jgi:CRISPR-associated protein Csm3
MSIKILKHYKIKGILRCETGLRIGGTGGVIEIGGVDNPIIRDAFTRLPYIPGSSLKGKMRSLLELRYGKIEPDGDVHKYHKESCKDTCFICRIFGTSAGDNVSSSLGSSRLIVRDGFPTPESKDKLESLRREQGLYYAEVKSENTLNRVTAKANLRQMERVPAGTEFEIELVYRVFDTNDGGKTDEDYLKYVKEGLKLVQEDALGGSGSRGYGKVKFINLKLIKEDGSEEDFALA